MEPITLQGAPGAVAICETILLQLRLVIVLSVLPLDTKFWEVTLLEPFTHCVSVIPFFCVTDLKYLELLPGDK